MTSAQISETAPKRGTLPLTLQTPWAASRQQGCVGSPLPPFPYPCDVLPASTSLAPGGGITPNPTAKGLKLEAHA